MTKRRSRTTGSLTAVVLFCAAALSASAADEASLEVTRGLVPHQVLQRDAHDRAAVSLEGTSTADGVVEARVVKGSAPALAWRQIGEARNGQWTGRLKGIPTGGEYTVELRVRDADGNAAASKTIDHVLVGDLWVLAGQSNMQGVGDLVDVEPPSVLVHSFDMADRWQIAEEPLHWLLEAADSVHWRGLEEAERKKRAEGQRQNRTKGAGLGLPFAKEMVRRTSVPVGLVPCAHGGTSMDQWSPALKEQGGASLYGAMLRRVAVVGGRVKGLLWYQGESDALNAERFPEFAGKFAALISAVRADIGQPELPFYYVQLGRVIRDGDPTGWNAVQEDQRRIAEEVAHTAVVPAIDLELDDLIHVGTDGLKRLGRRMAVIACGELFGHEHLQAGPHLESVTLESGGRVLRVAYRGVNRTLTPASHIAGFSIRKADGTDVPLIFEAMVATDQPKSVLLKLARPIPEGAALWYGHGFDPYCNLRDAVDMAAPVFGPVPLQPAPPAK